MAVGCPLEASQGPKSLSETQRHSAVVINPQSERGLLFAGMRFLARSQQCPGEPFSICGQNQVGIAAELRNFNIP